MITKPPIGLMPRWRYLELHPFHNRWDLVQRLCDVNGAVIRYEAANIHVPLEWKREQQTLILQLKK